MVLLLSKHLDELVVISELEQDMYQVVKGLNVEFLLMGWSLCLRLFWCCGYRLDTRNGTFRAVVRVQTTATATATATAVGVIRVMAA